MTDQPAPVEVTVVLQSLLEAIDNCATSAYNTTSTEAAQQCAAAARDLAEAYAILASTSDGAP